MSDESRMTLDEAQVDALHVQDQADSLKRTSPKDILEDLAATRINLYNLASDVVDHMKQTMPRTYEQYRVKLAALAELDTTLGQDKAKQLILATYKQAKNQPEDYHQLSIEARIGQAVSEIRQLPQWQDVPERLWGRVIDFNVNEIRVTSAVAGNPGVKITQRP